MANQDAESQVQTSLIHLARDMVKKMRSRFYSWRHLAWIILLVSTFNVVCIGGKRRAFGVFIASLHKSFNSTSMAELNWIGDSYASLGFFLMPFTSTMILRLNRPYQFVMFIAGILMFISDVSSAFVSDPGYLFLTHTLIHGVASSIVLCTTSLITGEYFDKSHPYHVLATAFVSGGPYGALIFGPLFSQWIHDYSWRMAFIFTGVFFIFVAWLGACAFVPYPIYAYDQYTESSCRKRTDEDSTEKRYQTAEESTKLNTVPTASGGRGWALCSRQHLKENPQIFLWGLERLVHNLVMYGMLMNLTTYTSKVLGNEIVDAARINLYYGIGESITFTVGAMVGDHIRGHLALVYLFGSAVAALVLIIIERVHSNVTAFFILGGLSGASIGVGNTFLYATAEEIMLVHGSIAFPMTKMIAGIGMLLAPLFSGAVIDQFNFNGFFISMAILVAIRVALLCGIYTILRRKYAVVAKNQLQAEVDDKSPHKLQLAVKHRQLVTGAVIGEDVSVNDVEVVTNEDVQNATWVPESSQELP